MAARLGAQLLTSRAAERTEDVLARILAVQAQDPRGARLAVRARSGLESQADMEDACTRRRSAVVSWLNRGTLHLVASDDYWWLHPLTTPQLRPGIERRLRQCGVDAAATERGVAVIVATVAEHGGQTRDQLRAALDRAGVPTAGQALVYLFFEATVRGHIVRGPWHGRDQAFVSVGDWLGPAPEPVPAGEALARLARRYLLGHGPSGPGDLAKWAGIPLGRAREAMAAVRDECTELDHGLVDLAGRPAPEALPAPSLLGPFDPVLHGWADRGFLVGDHRRVVTTNGIFRPVALVEGRVVGLWRLSNRQLEVELFGSVPAAARRRLSAEGRAVLAYLGQADGRVTVAGPGPGGGRP